MEIVRGPSVGRFRTSFFDEDDQCNSDFLVKLGPGAPRHIDITTPIGRMWYAAGLGFGGLDQRVDALQRSVVEPTTERMQSAFCRLHQGFRRMKENRGAAGVDGQSLAAFEKDLKGNLYRIWNRMSWGSYMPPPMRLVEIPKADGKMRPLGIPTVADSRPLKSPDHPHGVFRADEAKNLLSKAYQFS